MSAFVWQPEEDFGEDCGGCTDCGCSGTLVTLALSMTVVLAPAV